MEDKSSRLHQYFMENRDAMLSLWREIVDISSGTSNKHGVDEVGKVLAREMEKSGIQVKFVEEEIRGNTLIGLWNQESGRQPIIFSGHMDTVFEKQTEEGRFHLEGEKAYGHGVLDMKGGLVMSIFICRALEACGYKDRSIKFVFAGDEELMHADSHTADTMRQEMEGGFAAFNFETGDVNNGIVVGRLGAEIFKIETEGKEAHSGNDPKNGRNALEEMAHKIVDLQGLNDIENGKLVNVSMISAGEKTNIIPGSCTAQGCFRFQTNEMYRELKEKILNICQDTYVGGTKGKYRAGSKIECMEPREENYRLFELMRKESERLGFGQLRPIIVGGASDAFIPASLGIPVVCGVGVKGEHNHTMQEYALTDSIFERSELIANTVLCFDE